MAGRYARLTNTPKANPMSQKIVVLDGHTLNPGDLSWEPIEALGDVTVYPRSTPSETVERAGDAEVVFTNKAVLNAETLGQLSKLQYVGVLATGVNVVDLDAAKARGVTVTNVPGYSSASVAQHVFALVLAITNRIAEHDRAVHEGQWVSCEDFSFTVSPLMELDGKTLGIVGLGDIGQRVARIGAALGMRVVTPTRPGKPTGATTTDDGTPVERIDMEAVFAEADVLTLHCPLTDDTKHLVSADRLARMKSSALLINTGRGPLVDEDALASALEAGVEAGGIAGAGLDVLSSEPPEDANPLLRCRNCVITPHVAWATREARRRLMGIAAANLGAFQRGEPVNVVG